MQLLIKHVMTNGDGFNPLALCPKGQAPPGHHYDHHTTKKIDMGAFGLPHRGSSGSHREPPDSPPPAQPPATRLGFGNQIVQDILQDAAGFEVRNLVLGIQAAQHAHLATAAIRTFNAYRKLLARG